jgi:hypothetical protein
VALVEAVGQVAHDGAVLGRQQHEIQLLILAIADHRGNQIARGRRLDREDRGVFRLLRIGCEVAAVIGRPFLVAERLEAILQVLFELLIELLGLEFERLFIGILAAADHALAQGEEELSQSFLPPLRLDELEDGMAEVVDQPRIAEAAVSLEVRHLGHDVGDGRVAHRHQI